MARKPAPSFIRLAQIDRTSLPRINGEMIYQGVYDSAESRQK